MLWVAVCLLAYLIRSLHDKRTLFAFSSDLICCCCCSRATGAIIYAADLGGHLRPPKATARLAAQWVRQICVKIEAPIPSSNRQPRLTDGLAVCRASLTACGEHGLHVR